MALSTSELTFYTPDGKIVYDRGKALGLPRAIVATEVLPPEALAADCYTVPAPEGYQFAVRGRKSARTWALRGGKWEELPVNTRAEAERSKHPYSQANTVTWDHNDGVEIRWPAGGASGGSPATFRTVFDRQTGRFLTDQWVAIARTRASIGRLSRAGLMQISANSPARVFLNDDPRYDWQAGGTFALVTDSAGRSWLLVAVHQANASEEVLLVWDQTSWRPVSAGEELRRLYDQRAENLLQGKFWRVQRQAANTLPVRTFWRHWPWESAETFSPVTIDRDHPLFPDVFDYERVNGLSFFKGQLWLATDAGVVVLDPDTGTIKKLLVPPASSAVTKITESNGNLIIEAGGIFQWDETTQQWVPWSGENPFESRSVLWESNRWRIVQGNPALIFHRLDPACAGFATGSDRGRPNRRLPF